MRLRVSVNDYRRDIKHPYLYAVNQHFHRLRHGERLGAPCLPNTNRDNMGGKVMKEYKATLILESFWSYAENKEKAEEDFWDIWHERKDDLKWELVVDERD